MAFIETSDGTSLFYYDWGSGKPVVFIHGWVLGADMWEYQTTFLADRGFRCVAYDSRGCGRSDKPGHGYDHDTLADDLAAVLEQLDLNEVTLVAHSMACGYVARYLSRHGSDRVARVALIGAMPPFPLEPAGNGDAADGNVFEGLMAALREDRPHFVAISAPAFFTGSGSNGSVSPEILQWASNLFMQASPKATIDMVPLMAGTDIRPDVGAFDMPTLIIHGDCDTNAPVEGARMAAQAIEGSELKVYEGAAHGLFFTEKERLNRDLGAFIRS